MRFLFLATALLSTSLVSADQALSAFPGKVSEWRGFTRYDFSVDGKSLMVIAPQEAAAGHPWVWHGEFFGHKPAPDVALLKDGYHIVYMSIPNMLGCPQAVEHWNKAYQELTSNYGLAKKVALVGLSRGGLYCYNWAIANPDKVACIYGDAPVCDFKSWPGGKGTGKGHAPNWDIVLKLWEFKDDAAALAYQGNPVDNLEPLAKARVPLLHVFGDADDVVPWEENTGLIAERYKKLGGTIQLIRKPGIGHHPHGLEDSTPIIEFIKKHTSVKPESASTTCYAHEALVKGLSPLLDIFCGKQREYSVSAEVTLPIDDKPQTIHATLNSFGDGGFDLALTHADYSLRIQRRETETAFALPHHQVVFYGEGPVAEHENLSARMCLQRLISDQSKLRNYLAMQGITDPNLLVALIKPLLSPKFDGDSDRILVDDLQFEFVDDGNIALTHPEFSAKLSFQEAKTPQAIDDWDGMQVIKKERVEIERTITRGINRMTEILAPAKTLTSPFPEGRKVDNGELRWIDGQRVCLLRGTPGQIGKAHGELLKRESIDCIDSVLYAFGLVNTIRTGTWFRDDLEKAYAQLSPHIPERHKQETAALAHAIGIDNDLAQALNVFPELFHCSGFAVFDSATKDGKLYHGRVLDYMTTIGLQDCATTFIVKPDGYLPFVNVGYAAFVGSVSGMNSEGISLGEMGGRGEGAWDGVPMATLMRRALEECETLQEVKDLWTNNPRTCEYYYVFADGKTNEAVGVAALPESVEFINPGQSHERLGEGVPDAVVLSAGSRLEKLRERVQEKHGQIDAETAMWLMSRPVAMQSNLHNVLFVPADGILYVANASHKRPAAEEPYVKLDLRQLLLENDANAPLRSVSK